MEPVLLSVNNDKINSEIEFYNSLLPFFQGMYDALQAIGITPTLQDLVFFSQRVNQQNNTESWQLNYVTNYLVQQAGPVSFNGVLLDIDKVKALLSVPDLTGFIAATSIPAFGRLFTQVNRGVNGGYLQLVDNVISLADDAEATITAKYTIYTSSDAGVLKTNSLQAICDTLNAYDADNGKQFYTSMYNSTFPNDKAIFPLMGLRLYHGAFAVDPAYIMRYEANN